MIATRRISKGQGGPLGGLIQRWGRAVGGLHIMFRAYQGKGTIGCSSTGSGQIRIMLVFSFSDLDKFC